MEINARTMVLHGRDESGQPRAQPEARVQASAKRGVDLSVGSGQFRALSAAADLVVLESDRNFLERCMSGVRPWKPVIAYIDDSSDGVGEIGVGSARKTGNVALGSVDDADELASNRSGAVVVVAAIELRKDAVALVAEAGELALHVGGPLGGDRGGSADEGHGTGGEDSKDGEETHGEEAGEGYLG